jgi:hypothetical protein
VEAEAGVEEEVAVAEVAGVVAAEVVEAEAGSRSP